MYRGIEAIEHFMVSIGLTWQPGRTQSAELRASYRIGNTRPLGIDCTLVEFHCDSKRPKVWVPEFSRTSFHQWFEVPFQDFEFTPGRLDAEDQGRRARQRPALQRGPEAARLSGLPRPAPAGPRYSGLYMMVVPSSRFGSRASRANPGITPTVR